LNILFLFILLSPLIFSNNAYAEDLVMEQITPNGKIKVQISWPEVLPDQLYNVGISFIDPDTDQLLDNVSITYDVVVLQYDAIIELYHNQNTNNGVATFEVVFPEDGTGPAQVIVAVTSIRNGSDSVQMDEEVSFDVQVVPEFATIAIVMAFSIATVIALSRVSISHL